MDKDCEMKLPGCDGEAAYVTGGGACGDCFACGPCMNKAEDVEPGDWVPLHEFADFRL